MGFKTGLFSILAIAATAWAIDDFEKFEAEKKKTAQRQKNQALLEQQAVWVAKLEARAQQLRIERDAAEELRQKKFMKKVAWSAVRHAVMAILLPGIGNLAEKAYFALDAMDLTDLISVS
jgi:hypothetical protein